MGKTALIMILALHVFAFANAGGAAAQAPAGGDLPRYLPPVQTRDEIIREELLRQEREAARACQVPAVVAWFAAGSAQIRPVYVRAVGKIAACLEAHPEKAVTLNGYSDNAGGSDANVRLSERRARAVKDILINEFKIDGSRIRTQGRGGGDPIASNGTAAGRQKNRRVEAVIEAKK
jgi:outer membrane protein OmpA-like peptidoglycan-associated protein